MVEIPRRLIGTALAAGVLAAAGMASAQSLQVTGSCRDGQPHGAYELRSAATSPRVGRLHPGA
jgi:hypothetical protein